MRHDLNNILQVVLANLELLEPSVRGDAKSASRLKVAHEALERALAVIDALPDTRIPGSVKVPRLRILLCEDEALVRMTTAELLAEMGHDVAEAANAAQAMAALARPFDMLITDLNLPDMHGDDLAAAARERQPDLAVVIATGEQASATPGTATSRRYVWLLKPFNGARLREAMRIAIQST